MFSRLDIKITGMSVPIIIIKPPIVGVPTFLSSPSSPSARIFSPICFLFK